MFSTLPKRIVFNNIYFLGAYHTMMEDSSRDHTLPAFREQMIKDKDNSIYSKSNTFFNKNFNKMKSLVNKCVQGKWLYQI